MGYLLDTNILVRLVNAADSKYAEATRAVVELHRRGETLHVTPQVLIEFRSVATRPATLNGLGLSLSDVTSQSARFESMFYMLPDRPEIYPAWKQIVDGSGITGRQVHDARLLAVCLAHKVSGLMTFDVAHFMKLAAPHPELIIIKPSVL